MKKANSILKDINVVLMDCDGVLYDKDKCNYRDIALAAFDKALASYNISQKEANKKHDELRKKGIHGLLNVALHLCNTHDISFRDFAATMAHNTNYDLIPPDKEMLQLLKKLGKKIPIYIVTDNTWTHLFQVMQRLNGGNFKQFCDVNISPIAIEDTIYDGFFHPKKAEGQFLNLCVQVGQMPHNVLVLDDSEDVCAAASAQGLQVQQVQNPEQTKIILRRLIDERPKTKRFLSVWETRGRVGR